MAICEDDANRKVNVRRISSSTTAFPFAFAEQGGTGLAAREQAAQRFRSRDANRFGEGREGGEKFPPLVFREGFDLCEDGCGGLAHGDADEMHWSYTTTASVTSPENAARPRRSGARSVTRPHPGSDEVAKHAIEFTADGLLSVARSTRAAVPKTSMRAPASKFYFLSPCQR